MRSSLVVAAVFAFAASAHAQWRSPAVVEPDPPTEEVRRDPTFGDVMLEGLGTLGGTAVIGGAGAGIGALIGLGVAEASRPPCTYGDCRYSDAASGLMIGAAIGASLAPFGAAIGTWLAADLLHRHGNAGFALIGALLGSGVVALTVALVIQTSLHDATAIPIACAAALVPVLTVGAFELGGPTVTVAPSPDLAGATLVVGGAT